MIRSSSSFAFDAVPTEFDALAFGENDLTGSGAGAEAEKEVATNDSGWTAEFGSKNAGVDN